jgi:hypothetical protein
MGRISKKPKTTTVTKFFDKDDNPVEPGDPHVYRMVEETFNDKGQKKTFALAMFLDKDDNAVELHDPNGYWMLRCTYDENNQCIDSMWARRVDKAEEKEKGEPNVNKSKHTIKRRSKH